MSRSHHADNLMAGFENGREVRNLVSEDDISIYQFI